jgi:hypothetical protein
MTYPQGGPDPDLPEPDPNGPAVPDEASAQAAQEGVQEAFTVAPD